MTVTSELRPEEIMGVSASFEKVFHKEVAIVTGEASVPKRANMENVRLREGVGVQSPIGWEWLVIE